MNSLDGLSLIEINQNLFRNIVSLRNSENLFDDLSDEPDDWAEATRLEIEIKPIFFESSQPIIDRPFEESQFLSNIDYPFTHWMQTRFSRGFYGVWYGSREFETTIYETVYHWNNGLLADAGWQNYEGISIERRVHLIPCNAALINLLPKEKKWKFLKSNDYTECQQLGSRIHKEGHPGLWTPSARYKGINAAIFIPKILSNSRMHCYLTYKKIKNEIHVFRDPKKLFMRISNQ
ncbi:MAG: RES family NAD+ phosphorylase [Pseudomonadota bacterium]